MAAGPFFFPRELTSHQAQVLGATQTGLGGQPGGLHTCRHLSRCTGPPTAFSCVFSPSAKFRPPHQGRASAWKLVGSPGSHTPPRPSTSRGPGHARTSPGDTHANLVGNARAGGGWVFIGITPPELPPACNHIECLIFRALGILLSTSKQTFLKFPKSVMPEIGLQSVLLDVGFCITHVGQETLVRCFLQPRHRLNTSQYHFIPPASHSTFSFHRQETDACRGRELDQGHRAGKCWTRGCAPGGKPHARQRPLSLKMSLTFKICMQKITFKILIFGIDFSSSQLCPGQEQGSAAPPICSEDRRQRKLRPGSVSILQATTGDSLHFQTPKFMP